MFDKIKNRFLEKRRSSDEPRASTVLNVSLLHDDDDDTPIFATATATSVEEMPLTGGGFGTSDIEDDSYAPITCPGVISLGKSMPQRDTYHAVPLSSCADDHLSAGELREKYSVQSGTGVDGFAVGGAQMNPKESARRAKVRAAALAKQKANNAQFINRMKAEEDRYLLQHKARQSREEADLALAIELSKKEAQRSGVSNMRSPSYLNSNSLQGFNGVNNSPVVAVQVPPGGFCGQIISVAVPGHGTVAVTIPPGVLPGQTFQFPLQTHKLVRFRVPDNLQEGNRTVKVKVSNGYSALVKIPLGIEAGEEIIIRVDSSNFVKNSQNTTIQTKQNKIQQEKKIEEESFLAALPEEIRREILAAGLHTQNLPSDQQGRSADVGSSNVVNASAEIIADDTNCDVPESKKNVEESNLIDVNDDDDDDDDDDGVLKSKDTLDINTEEGIFFNMVLEPNNSSTNNDAINCSNSNKLIKKSPEDDSKSKDSLDSLFGLDTGNSNVPVSCSFETVQPSSNKEQIPRFKKLTRSEMLEKLKTAKSMLNDGLITQSEHDDVKKEVLAMLKAKR